MHQKTNVKVREPSDLSMILTSIVPAAAKVVDANYVHNDLRRVPMVETERANIIYQLRESPGVFEEIGRRIMFVKDLTDRRKHKQEDKDIEALLKRAETLRVNALRRRQAWQVKELGYRSREPRSRANDGASGMAPNKRRKTTDQEHEVPSTTGTEPHSGA